MLKKWSYKPKCTSAAKAALQMHDLRHPSTSLRTGSEAVPLSKAGFFSTSKAPLQQMTCGAAEAVPLSTTGFFRSL
jgi:hypothetical protein